MIFWMRTRCPGPLDERGSSRLYFSLGILFRYTSQASPTSVGLSSSSQIGLSAQFVRAGYRRPSAYMRSGTLIPKRPSPSWSIVQTEAVIFKRNCLSASEPSRMGVVL